MCPPLALTTSARRPLKELHAEMTCAGWTMRQYLLIDFFNSATLLWGFEQTCLSKYP